MRIEGKGKIEEKSEIESKSWLELSKSWDEKLVKEFRKIDILAEIIPNMFLSIHPILRAVQFICRRLVRLIYRIENGTFFLIKKLNA